MLRDFSDSSKNKLIDLISQVENEKYSNFTDWIGDRWYDFEEWISVLNISNYINNVNNYHKKVIDKNNATKDSIEKIFNNVKNVNNTYYSIFGNIDNLLGKWQIYIDAMNTIVSPENGKFNAGSMDGSLRDIISDIGSCKVRCLKDQMVQNIDGEIVFNQDLIYEYIKKDPTELSGEERAMLIDIISELKDIAVIYETLATCGTDQLGVDILNYVSWLADNDKYESFAAVSAHYNEIYINLLNYISEQSEDNTTFAASLVKISNGEIDFNVLGIEYSDTIGKLFGGTSFTIYAAQYKSEHTEQYFAKLEASEKDNIKALDDFSELNDGIKDKLKNANLSLEEKYKSYSKDGIKINDEDAPTFYDKKLTLAELKKQIGLSASLYDGTFDIGEDGKLNVVVGNAEVHASISGGFYVVGKNKEKKFSPGVNAEIGASVTALEIDWEQQLLGNEYFGLNTEVNLTVGKAEAKADIGAHLYDEDGKLDIQLGASASAEVIAAELDGSIGVNILGGEVGLNGSVNFGIGAHADVGYKDGVFKFDVGASFGLGISVGAEIDVGGMVDTVCDAASSAWNDLKDGWNGFWSKW